VRFKKYDFQLPFFSKSVLPARHVNCVEEATQINTGN